MAIAIIAALGVGGILGSVATTWLQHHQERRSGNRTRRLPAYTQINRALDACRATANAASYAAEKAVIYGDPTAWPWHELREDLRSAHEDITRAAAEAKLVASDEVAASLDRVTATVWATVIMVEPIYTAFFATAAPETRKAWSEPVYALSGNAGAPEDDLRTWIEHIMGPLAKIAEMLEKEISAVREHMKSELGTRGR